MKERGSPCRSRTCPPRTTHAFTSDLVVGNAAEQTNEVERLIGLGATRVEWDSYSEDSDYVVLADTEHNLFCVVDASHG